MAKKKKSNLTEDTGNLFDLSKLSGVMATLSKKSIVQIENLKDKRGYISTDIYILNAMLSASIKNGGVPKNRMTVFAGPFSTGKSYIVYNIERNAQKDGYNIIHIDTEYSVELSDFDMFGVDVSDAKKFMLIREGEVERLKMGIATILDELKKLKDSGVDVTKTLFVVDSFGQMASRKEKTDAVAGKDKQDMATRSKALNSLMRIMINDLGYLGIPLVATNHTYLTMDLFPQTVQKGGEGVNYTPSVIIYLTASKLKGGNDDDDSLSSGQSGIVVTARARKNRLAKPKKIKFEIDFDKGVNKYKGLDFFCTPENFEKVGIAKVKPVVDKETGEITYKPGGKWYVRHLDKTFFDSQLYNGTVFNSDVIDALEPIAQEYFRYPTYEEAQIKWEEIDAKYSQLESDADDEFDIDIDSDAIDKTLFE